MLEDKLDYWRAWQRLLYSAGYAGLSWPKEYGGGGADAKLRAVFNEELDRAGAPERLNIVGEDFAADRRSSSSARRPSKSVTSGSILQPGDEHLVSVVLRAGGGLGPGLVAHVGHQGGWRMAHPGAEDLDEPGSAGGPRDLARPHRWRSPAQRDTRTSCCRWTARASTSGLLPTCWARAEIQRGLPRRRVHPPTTASSVTSTAAGKSQWPPLAFERVAIATGQVNTTGAVNDLIREIA